MVQFFKPFMHIASRPKPRYRMSKEAIIFRPTGIEVIDHLLFTRPIPTIKVMGCKTSEQQLCLIQPGSMSWLPKPEPVVDRDAEILACTQRCDSGRHPKSDECVWPGDTCKRTWARRGTTGNYRWRANNNRAFCRYVQSTLPKS